MNGRKITLLGLWTVGVVAVAWGLKWHAASDHVRADLVAAQKIPDRHREEIRRFEKRNQIVADHVPDLSAKAKALPPPVSRTAREALARVLSEKERYRALANDPQMMQLTRASRRAYVRIRYRELYHQLRFTPTQISALETLLTEEQERVEDVRVAATLLNEPMSNPNIRSLLADEKRAVEKQEEALLGPEAFRTLQTFEQTAAGRALVSDVSRALTFTEEPLQREQKTRLNDLLKPYRATELGDDPADPPFDWEGLQTKAATFLTARQRAELGSTIASVQYRRQQREYMKMLEDWVRQNSPADR